jgi:hypothetical protein
MKNASEGLRKIYTNLFASHYVIFLICLAVLISPLLIRGFVLHGQESYFYFRISNFILENNIPNYDFLSFGGRAFFYSIGSPLFLVLASLIFKIGVNTLLAFTPFIFGFLSIILFYLILKHFKITRNTLSFACYILLLSPPFLYAFTHFTSFTLPLFLNLLGFFLVLKKRKIFGYLAFIVYLLLPFFDFIHAFFGLSLLFFYFYKTKQLKRLVPYSFIALLTIYLNNHFVTYGMYIIPHKFYEYFFTFGGAYGFSIFLVLLSFFGLLWLWQRKYRNLIYYTFILLSAFLLILNIYYIIYLALILSVLGAFGLKYLYKLKWSSSLIKNLTVILLIGGILISGISFLYENSKLDPDEGLNDALLYLASRTSPRNVILSHEKYGIYINSISNRKDFIDINYAYAPRSKLRLFYLNKLFYSRNLNDVLDILNEFKVNYILITPDMKNGLVWNRNNEGLLYLFNKNPDYFYKVYDEDGFEIWRVS